jgi:NADH:ubiquinone oxidoreductase subunit C
LSSEELEPLARSLGATVGKGLHTIVVAISKEKVRDACSAISALPGLYHLSTITAVDNGDRIELLYHFWRGKSFVAVRTELKKDGLTLESVSDLLASATLYEAEIHDLFGVTFTGNPYTGRRLLLPDDYPKDAPPPLRTEADPEKIRKLMELE